VSKRKLSKREVAFWRAYLEILRDRTPLVDTWSDGHVTWHPRVIQKMIWYSSLKDTIRNRGLVHDWLMDNARSASKV
jgi:uncharacterized protein YegL